MVTLAIETHNAISNHNLNTTYITHSLPMPASTCAKKTSVKTVDLSAQPEQIKQPQASQMKKSKASNIPPESTEPKIALPTPAPIVLKK
jgi:hypothetical protein